MYAKFASLEERLLVEFLVDLVNGAKFQTTARDVHAANGFVFVMDPSARIQRNLANLLELLNAERFLLAVHGKREILVFYNVVVAVLQQNVLERSVHARLENADGLDSKFVKSGFTNASGASIPKLLVERSVAELLQNAMDSKDAKTPSLDADGLDQHSTPPSLEDVSFPKFVVLHSNVFAVSIVVDVSMESAQSLKSLARKLDPLLRDNQDNLVHGNNSIQSPRDLVVANGLQSAKEENARIPRRSVLSLDQFTTTIPKTNANWCL